MTVGEKIKCFRTLKKMTQKALGEKAGIGEATIRKYELGIRNPKPVQLKKIAQALEIGENILLDIPLNTLRVETVGDVMALLLLLESRVGISYSYEEGEDNSILAPTIKLKFQNMKVNECLAEWILYKKGTEKRALFISSNKKKFSQEERERMFTIEKSLLEVEKQKHMDNNTLLDRNEKLY